MTKTRKSEVCAYIIVWSLVKEKQFLGIREFLEKSVFALYAVIMKIAVVEENIPHAVLCPSSRNFFFFLREAFNCALALIFSVN